MPPQRRNLGFKMADMVAYHKVVNEIWENSVQYRESLRLFERSILPLQTFTTDQALCIAIGSFESAYDDTGDEYGIASVGRRAFFQLVAFETWIRLLRTRSKSQFEKGIYFQDPALTAPDIRFLQDRGYKVVSNPPGAFSPIDDTIQEMMTPHTFAFIPCGRRFTYLLYQCLKVSHPALLISTAIPPQRPENPFIGSPEKEASDEIERRRISRPFFSSRLFCPLFKFTNHSSGPFHVYDKLRAEKKFNKLDDGLKWTDNPWIYWTPDNKSRLKKYGMEDDMEEYNPEWAHRIEKKWSKALTRAPSVISTVSDSRDAEQDQPVSEASVKGADYTATVTKILENHHRSCTASWTAGPVCKEIDQFFEENILPLKTMKIDRAICLALGTFGYLYNFDDPQRHNYPDAVDVDRTQYSPGDCIMTQFVAFEHWIDLLRSVGNVILPGNIFIQDPALTAYDKAFFNSRGYTFTGEPRTERFDEQSRSSRLASNEETAAQKMTTPSTFIFAPCGTLTHLIHHCLEVAHPPLLISSPLDAARHLGTSQILELGYLAQMKRNAHLSPYNAQYLRDALAERAITRPFYSARRSRALVPFTDYPHGHGGEYYPGLAQEQMADLSPEEYFVQDMWVYWRPDGAYGLRTYSIEDDIECTCHVCQAGGKPDVWWRRPRAFPEDEVRGSAGEVWEPNSDDELGGEEEGPPPGSGYVALGGGIGSEVAARPKPRTPPKSKKPPTRMFYFF